MSYIYNENGEKEYSQSIYVQKYYNELFINLLESADEEELISHNELFEDYVKNKDDISSYYVMTLSIISDSEEDIYYDMNDVYYSSKVDYALGDDLDDIGSIVGCPRPTATRAGVELLFTVHSRADESIVLPKNIIVSTIDGISYYTLERVVVPSGSTEAKAYALSIEPGIDYRVESNSLTKIETVVELSNGEAVNLTVTNPLSSTGGRDAYNDEEYRVLIKDWIKSNIKGSKEAYDKYFASFDGLDSYKLIPNWNGSGTLKVVLDPGYPYQLKQCYDELMGSVCQMPIDITMFSPERVVIDIYARCNVDIDEVNVFSDSEKDEIKSRIKDAIKLYIDGDVYNYTGLKIGQDFIPYKLGVFLSEKVPELKNVVFEYPKEPITINDEEIGVCNDINIEMG